MATPFKHNSHVLVYCLLILSLVCCVTKPLYAAEDDTKIANYVSWATVITQASANIYKAAKSEEPKKELFKIGLKNGITEGSTVLVKHFIHKTRPDGSDNKSFWSGHSAFAATNQGWNYYVGISLTAATGIGRHEAKKHFWIDVLAGAAVGSLVDRVIR